MEGTWPTLHRGLWGRRCGWVAGRRDVRAPPSSDSRGCPWRRQDTPSRPHTRRSSPQAAASLLPWGPCGRRAGHGEEVTTAAAPSVGGHTRWNRSFIFTLSAWHSRCPRPGKVTQRPLLPDPLLLLLRSQETELWLSGPGQTVKVPFPVLLVFHRFHCASNPGTVLRKA